MGLLFKHKRNTKNTSDNNITISTSTDIMYKIGNELGEINVVIKSLNDDLKSIYRKLNNHSKRITELEKKIK